MSNQTSSSGMSLAGVLTVVFVVLKLVGVIAWKWIWVLSPLWISLGLGLAVLAIGGLVALIALIVSR